MSDRRKTHLHIGAHKTASSFLQANIRANREALAKQGLDTILRGDILETPFAKELYAVSQATHDPGNVTAQSARSLRTILSGLEQNILISCEGLVCRLKVEDFYQNISDAVRYIAAALPESDIHYIFYVRRQPDFIESIYMQYVHLGRSLSFEKFLEKAAEVDFSWLRVVEGLEAGAGRARITVRAFETIRSLGATGFFQDFLRHAGLEDPGAFTVPEVQSKARAANRSYSEVAMKIARRSNPMLKGKERKVLRKFLQEHFSTATHPRAELFTPEQRQDLIARHAAKNRTLFERYDLGAPGEALQYF